MPYKNPATRAAYRKRYNEIHRDTRRVQHRQSQRDHQGRFVGVDGEGGNIGDRHRYLLLRAGTRTLETGSDLSTLECFDFLSSLEPGVKYVSYFFTYDVTMILRDLPIQKMRDLLNREGRTPRNSSKPPRRILWNSYRFDWLPGKEFRIGKIVRGQPFNWVVIEDVGSFFQCSFVAALERWNIGSPELRARILASKLKRSEFGAITDLTRLYNKKECDLLAELMEEFRTVVGSVGPLPRHWQGPGNLASAWLAYHEVPSVRNVPDECMAFARDGYYGGRFEITAVGSVRRHIYQYDINSAYPSIIRNLPCLVHGTWTHSIARTPRNRIYIAKVEFDNGQNAFLGTLPIRSKQGNISYPRRGSGIYWSVELQAAKRAGATIRVKEAWSYSTKCDCHPLEWVDEIYQLRRRVGKTKKGNALKLAMNSLYGKTAQSIGHPRWANPIWAGWITAGTRALIINACAQVKSHHILMIATDGIFSDVPLDLPLSSELGEWELTEHESMFIIQPGLYLLPQMKPKTRGIPQAKIIEYARMIRKSWNQDRELVHEIPLNRFLAARQSIHQRKWNQAGTWYTESRKVSFDWRTKRHESIGHWDDPLYPNDRPAFRPDIREGGEESVPYSKSIGIWGQQRSFDEDQPEEAEGLWSIDEWEAGEEANEAIEIHHSQESSK